MKIGMMSAWNETSGVSIHAELVAEQWIRSGNKLKVFSFLEEDFHGHSLIGVDQEYVIRCFGTPGRSNYLNPVPFLHEDYDFFVVQDLGMLPRDKLAKIFLQISRKSKTILVVHAASLHDDPSFYQFNWDAVVCFDQRYKRFLKEVYPEEKIHIIPFPCHRWLEGDKEEARRKLGLPLDRKIIFVFGQKWRHIPDTLPALRELAQEYPLTLYIISGAQRVLGLQSKGVPVVIKKEFLGHPALYDYLHAADAQILGKHSAQGVVLSSTAHLTMGSGCPIVARDSNFFEEMTDGVLKYKDLKEFKQNLVSIFTEDARCKMVRQAAKQFVEGRSAEKIANMFIDLFKSL